MLALLFSFVTGVLAVGQGTAAVEPVHRVSIEVLGPMAKVQVERGLTVGEQGTKTETVLDFDLPEGASLVDWEAEVAGKPLKLTPVPAANARASHAATLASLRLTPSPLPTDEAAVRVHMAPLAATAKTTLRYRYTAPLKCVDGRLVLRIPASMDAEPSPAQVTVQFKLPEASRLAEATVAGVPVHLSGRVPVVHVTAPRRAAWELAFALRGNVGPYGSLSAAWAPGHGREPSTMAVAMCRPQRPADIELPDEILLLFDRSRSVGAGGMSNQRDLARALLEAFPPAERFNAFMFARTAEQVFPLARTATREALESLVNAADPNRLENGTDLVSALERAAAWIKGDPTKPPRLLAIITDGAIPESQRAERLVAALDSADVRGKLRLLILMVRPAADERVSGEVVERLSRFAARFGGVVRVLTAEDTREVVRSAMTALRQGGDLFNVRVAGNEGPSLAANVGPGQGFTKMVSGPRSPTVRLIGDYQGTPVRVRLAALRTTKQWLPSPRNRGQAWAGQGREAAFFIEEVEPSAKPSVDGVVRGQMDPLVLRNALSLAFLPRARACYLSRRVGNSTDLNLHGRVRLELHLERGELEDAVIGGSSTLNRPEIERCVREAAFEIEYPRPMFRDAPTVAALNLVFRPSSVPETTHPDASEFDRQIDLALGQVTFDPKKLLEEEIESAAKNDDRKSSGE